MNRRGFLRSIGAGLVALAATTRLATSTIKPARDRERYDLEIRVSSYGTTLFVRSADGAVLAAGEFNTLQEAFDQIP